MRTCRLDNRRVQVLHLCDTNVCKMIPGAVITHLVTLLTPPPQPTQKNGLPLNFSPRHATEYNCLQFAQSPVEYLWLI